MSSINYREILNSHKSEIEKLKSDLSITRNDLSKLSNKYQFLLEKMLEINGNSKQKTRRPYK